MRFRVCGEIEWRRVCLLLAYVYQEGLHFDVAAIQAAEVRAMVGPALCRAVLMQ